MTDVDVLDPYSEDEGTTNTKKENAGGKKGYL
jgi:hypothetical protein